MDIFLGGVFGILLFGTIAGLMFMNIFEAGILRRPFGRITVLITLAIIIAMCLSQMAYLMRTT